MVITVYGLKSCDSCRKAMRALPGAMLVDVRAQGVPTGVMDAAFGQFAEALLNTRSNTWRSLSEEQRKGAPSELIAEHPTLMKRPLIAVDNALFLSWNKQIEDEVKALL